MKFYEFGKENNAVILLLPGTCCHWKLNFGEVICFYAKKMGAQYLDRYKMHFINPVIHELNMEHEELLVLYLEQWVEKIMNLFETGEDKNGR